MKKVLMCMAAAMAALCFSAAAVAQPVDPGGWRSPAAQASSSVSSRCIGGGLCADSLTAAATAPASSYRPAHGGYPGLMLSRVIRYRATGVPAVLFPVSFQPGYHSGQYRS